jgi:hypothetical protein
LVARLFATVKGCGHQARQATHLAAIVELAPAKELGDVQPSAVLTNAAQAEQAAHLVHTRTFSGAQQLGPLPFHFQNVLVDRLKAGILAFQPSAHAGWQGRAIPQADCVELLQKVRAHWQVHALTGQQAFEPVDVPRLVTFERQQLAVQMARVFRLDAGHVHHTPQLVLAQVIAHQHHHQLACVNPVGLGVLGATIRFDAGRIHHQILNVMGQQVAMQPESVAARFVATLHRCTLGQAEALLGPCDLLFKCCQVARRDLAPARFLTQSDREAQRPVLFAQLEGQVELHWRGHHL